MKRADPWRYACPQGHRNVRNRNAGDRNVNADHHGTGYYCKTCGKHYDGQPRDLKREEITV